MADVKNEVCEAFASQTQDLAQDVLFELESILRIHGISAQELFYKWESYNIKMGGDSVKLDLKTVRDFKKDIQDALERDSRGKAHARADTKRHVGATPRVARSSGAGDIFDSMEGITATPKLTPGAVAAKRRNNFETPASKVSKPNATSSPAEAKSTQAGAAAFADRPNAGQIEQTLNAHIKSEHPPAAPWSESRIKLKANSDMPKFGYKTMAVKLSEAAEALDERLEKFRDLVQEHYKLDFAEFGNPTIKTPNEIVAVGRIACDLQDGKLTQSSIVLEAPLRTASGVRVPLKFDNIASYDLFPGKVVAVRGTNASGEYFQVSQILKLPDMPSPAHSPAALDAVRERLVASGDEGASTKPLNILVGSGPYTADTNLDFEPLQALCEQAASTNADALILVGPFLDLEHPMVASGDFPPLPASLNIDVDAANLIDVFRGLITLPIQKLVAAVPSITILMVPSVRDAISKHAAFPQERMIRKDLGLPKQCSFVTNPICISFNEAVFAISSQDILYELKRQECLKGPQKLEPFPRLSKQLIEQRHFFPLYPPMSREALPKPTPVEGLATDFTQPLGASLDLSYLALAEFPTGVKPDVLICPSALTPFVNVVDSVVCINPGSVSKKRAAGTFARMAVAPLQLTPADRAKTEVGTGLFERSRVDIVRI